MLVFGGALFGIGVYQDIKPEFIMPITLMLEALMLIIGVKMGYIPFGILLTIMVLSLVIIGLWTAKKFNLLDSGGGGG